MNRFTIDTETFTYFFIRCEGLPKKFIKKGCRYLELKYISDGSAEDASCYVTLLPSSPHENKRVEDLSGGLFKTDYTLYLRII